MPLTMLLPAWLMLAAGPGPTVAVEDTMYTELPEVLVRAPRVTLDEILDRVASGEARREERLVDQSFTATVRMVRDAAGGKPPRLVEEAVWRVYRKRPDRLRRVLLRRHRERAGRGDGVNVDFSPGMGEQIVNFAFRADARRDYRYRIVGRDLVGGHLVYRLAFEPRSPLRIFEPSGLVWVDTNDFVIVREEITFRSSPVPLVLERVERMVVERIRVGDHWVMSRALIRARLTVPLPSVGKSFDIGIRYDDYALNSGLPDSLFSARETR